MIALAVDILAFKPRLAAVVVHRNRMQGENRIYRKETYRLRKI